jgi:hypothetical protein
MLDFDPDRRRSASIHIFFFRSWYDRDGRRTVVTLCERGVSLLQTLLW